MPEAEKISELYYNDNDVITLRELTRALQAKAMHFYNVSEEDTARQLFEAGLEYRSEPKLVASNDDLTITQKELRNVLERFAGKTITNPRNIAETIIGVARNVQIAESELKEEEPITRAQLRDALEIAGYPSDVGYVIRPATTTKPSFGARMNASDAVDAICKAKDEPEYKPGDIVQDAAGDLYKRYQDGWLGFRFQTAILSHATPERPLKKVTITT